MKDSSDAAVSARREFFRRLAREAATKIEELRGIPQLKLADLPALPLPRLAALQPGVLPGVQIFPANGCVFARVPRKPEPVPLFRLEGPDLAIFNRFNGTSTLADVAASVCAESGAEPQAVMESVRALFLKMVALGVCVPMNAPDPAPSA